MSFSSWRNHTATSWAKKFKRHLLNKRIICLDIPDEYEYMDPALVRLLKVKIDRFFPNR